MKRLWIILAVMVFLGTGASGAWAHGNHAHKPGGINPFEKGKVQKPAHCLLHHHRYPGQICPHHQHNPGSPIQELSTDCGGQPAGSLPATSFQGTPVFLISGINPISLSAVSGNDSSPRFPAATMFYDLSPPPPKSI